MTAKVLAGLALLTMFEDVEIMRQMVEQAVSNVYKSQPARYYPLLGVQSMPYAAPHGKATNATGTYLPGYGALIQLTATPVPKAEQLESKNGGKSISKWEAARRELRGTLGEKPKLAAGTRPRSGPTLGEVTRSVLDLLAENGHNLGELPSGERLTVDITFRDRADTHYSGSLFRLDEWPFAEAPYPEAYHAMPATSHLQPNPYQQPNSAAERTGDLHMRQKNYKQAVEAYRSALGYKLEQRNDESAPKNEVRLEELKSLMRKVAQAEVAAERYDQAADLLKMLADPGASQEGEELQAAALGLGNSHGSAAKLPPHLIISATKAQLDAVATGKMSREEFARAAQIDYLDPRVAATEAKRQKTGTDASE